MNLQFCSANLPDVLPKNSLNNYCQTIFIVNGELAHGFDNSGLLNGGNQGFKHRGFYEACGAPVVPKSFPLLVAV